MADNTIVSCSLNELEAQIIGLFRQQVSRLRHLPDGWVFSVDANPDRLIGSFTDKERCEVARPRRQAPIRNGHNGHGGG